MKARRVSRGMLVMVLASGLLVSAWAAGSAGSAQALTARTLGSGAFTLTHGSTANLNVSNLSEGRGIHSSVVVYDSTGNKVAEFTPRTVNLGHTASFEFDPMLPEGGDSVLVRFEMRVEGSSRNRTPTGFVALVEVIEVEVPNLKLTISMYDVK